MFSISDSEWLRFICVNKSNICDWSLPRAIVLSRISKSLIDKEIISDKCLINNWSLAFISLKCSDLTIINPVLFSLNNITYVKEAIYQENIKNVFLLSKL